MRRLCGRRSSLRLLLLAIFAVALAHPVMSAEPTARILKGAPLYEVLARDAIPSIDSPRFVTVKQARGLMAEDELVLGVSDGREAKCYSTWLLEGHEIVNDRLGGTPISVEW